MKKIAYAGGIATVLALAAWNIFSPERVPGVRNNGAALCTREGHVDSAVVEFAAPGNQGIKVQGQVCSNEDYIRLVIDMTPYAGMAADEKARLVNAAEAGLEPQAVQIDRNCRMLVIHGSDSSGEDENVKTMQVIIKENGPWHPDCAGLPPRISGYPLQPM